MKCPRCGDDDHDGPVCTCGGSPMKRKQEQIRGKLWNWLHDDLRKDEAKNALKRKKVRKHRHRYDRCKHGLTHYGAFGCICTTCTFSFNKMCSCGKVRP